MVVLCIFVFRTAEWNTLKTGFNLRFFPEIKTPIFATIRKNFPKKFQKFLLALSEISHSARNANNLRKSKSFFFQKKDRSFEGEIVKFITRPVINKVVFYLPWIDIAKFTTPILGRCRHCLKVLRGLLNFFAKGHHRIEYAENYISHFDNAMWSGNYANS